MSEQNLLNDNQNKVIKALDAAAEAGELTLDQVKALHAQESGGQKRQGVLAVIAKHLEALTEQQGADAPASDGQGEADVAAEPTEAAASPAQSSTDAKAARGEAPEWQKKDYSGPLTGEQALWRNKHITTK